MSKESILKLDQEINDIIAELQPAKRYISGKKLNTKVERALKELDQEHNTSWAVEIYRRNADNLDNTAIKYRGNSISYYDMFVTAYNYAKSLKQMGYKKGDEIPICVSNIPEFIYLILAVSFIGGKINVVGDWFDKDYLKSILNNTNSKYMFISDDNYEFIKEIIEESNIEKVIMVSLSNSLPKDKNNVAYNPYEEIEKNFHIFDNKVGIYKESNQKEILSIEEFLKIGENYDDRIVEICSIDEPFAITYTSGTTDPGCPKGCIHSNRSYITLSRFKESDVSGMPSMRKMTILAHIPTYTHMEISCAISDTLYEKCTLAMEPFYDKDFFIYSLIINKPNFVPASAGFWVALCKKLNYDEQFKNVNMPYLMIPTVTGEGCSKGEEKFLNYTSRKHKFGTERLPFPLAPVTFSIGGGTSESSGIFVTLFKALQEKKINCFLRKEGLGLTPHRFVDLEVLNENGEYCRIGEPGLLVANSPCNMLSYTNQSLNESIYITDKKGKTWFNLGTTAYKSDTYGRIKMKGRPNSNIYLYNEEKVPYYIIEDIIGCDTKNVMSTTLVKTNQEVYVCHIELQPESRTSKEKIVASLMNRLYKNVPVEILNNLYIKIRTFSESFPLAPSGKRNVECLENEEMTDEYISCKEYLHLKNGKVKKR